MPHRFLPLAAVAVLFLAGCSRDVAYYQEHTDEAQAKLEECLKMDNPKEDKECNAAAAALKKNLKNTVNNLLNMGQ